MPLGEDVNLDVVASLTENLSGADLQAILSDAQLEAVHSFLSSQKDSNDTSATQSERPIITMRVMSSVLLNARPSVSDQERRRLYNIYDMFMSARSSMSDKVFIHFCVDFPIIVFVNISLCEFVVNYFFREEMLRAKGQHWHKE